MLKYHASIKSNISSFIGRFYDKTNATEGQRDFGFNIFYVGINLGGFAALFVASYLSETYGFAAPFYSSLIVSMLVLINLIVGFFILAKHIKEVRINLAIVAKTTLILAVYFVVVFLVLKNPIIANVAITVAGLGRFIIMLVSAQKNIGAMSLLPLSFLFCQFYIGRYFFRSLFQCCYLSQKE